MTTKRAAFITGSGHSGSTLLQVILSSHSRAFGLGEAGHLTKKVKRRGPLPQLCLICEGRCEVWDETVPAATLRRHFGRSLRSSLARLLPADRAAFHREILELTGADLVVDSTKSPRWIRDRANGGRAGRSVTPVLFFITRDGRAVVNSYLRKYPDRDVRTAARKWKRSIRRCERFFGSWPPDRRFRLKYEDLAARPADVTKRICTFLSMPFEDSMLRYWEHEHHPVGGNLGTRSLILKYRAEQQNAVSSLQGRLDGLHDRHDGYYDRHGYEIKPDVRWREDLSSEDRQEIERVAGGMNRALGYDD